MNVARILRHSATQILAVFALFLILSIIMTWPLTRHIGSSVQDLGDPLFQTWILQAVQHQIVHSPLDLWDANAAYPFEMSLLFSEPHISTALLHWPIYAISGNDILAYNLLLLASFVTTGAGMALLIRELTGSRGAGIVAGTLAAFAPYRFGHMSHLNLLSYGWLMLALWLLVRFARTQRLRDAAGAGILLMIQFHASDTLAAFSLITLAVFIAAATWRFHLQRNRRFLLATSAAVAAPLVSFLPVILGRLEVNRLYGFERTLDELRASSAGPRDFLAVHPLNHAWADILPTAYPNPLFPGLIGLIAAGACILLAPKTYRPWIAGGGALAIIGGIMAIGPELRLRSFEIPMPYRLMYEYLPGGSSMRDVARFGMLTLLGIHILAGLGVAAVLSRFPQQVAGIPRSYLSAGAVALACLIILVEFRTDVDAVEVDRSPERLAAYEWLVEQPEGPVIEFPADGLFTDVLRAISPMYYSTYHWNPVVALFSTFSPPGHFQILEGIHDFADGSYVTETNAPILQDLDIRYVLIRHNVDGYDSQTALEVAHQVDSLTYVDTFGDTSVFILADDDPEPPAFTLAAPDQTVAGEEVMLSAIVWNPRPGGMLVRSTSSRDVAIRGAWFDPDGQEVSSSIRKLGQVLYFRQEATVIPVPVISPAEAGEYRVELELEGVEAEIESTQVVVLEEPREVDGVDVNVHSLNALAESHSPGDWIQVTMSAVFPSVPDLPIIVTLQLLDSHGVVAQFDRWPFDARFGGHYPEPGRALTIPATLRIPEDLKPGNYRLLFAMYQPEKDQAPRLTLAAPGEEEPSTEIIVDLEIHPRSAEP